MSAQSSCARSIQLCSSCAPPGENHPGRGKSTRSALCRGLPSLCAPGRVCGVNSSRAEPGQEPGWAPQVAAGPGLSWRDSSLSQLGNLSQGTVNPLSELWGVSEGSALGGVDFPVALLSMCDKEEGNSHSLPSRLGSLLERHVEGLGGCTHPCSIPGSCSGGLCSPEASGEVYGMR